MQLDSKCPHSQFLPSVIELYNYNNSPICYFIPSYHKMTHLFIFSDAMHGDGKLKFPSNDNILHILSSI